MKFMPDKLDDREDGFIRAALASSLFPERPFPEPPAGLDWEQLDALLRRYRLTTHFYVLGKSKRSSWPASFRERLRQDRYGLIIYGELFAGRISPVLSALMEANIPVIVLKGWALIQTIYGGDYGQRIYEDIDILVHPKDINTSEMILKKLGWQQSEECRPGFTRRYYNAHVYSFLEQPEITGRVYSIGFHWGLLHHPAYNPKQIDVGCLFERAHPLEIAGVPVLEMSLEDHIVYNCAHVVLQHRSEEMLLRYYEIAAVIRNAKSSLDWQKVKEHASCWKLELPLKIVVKKVEEFWPGTLPASALTSIEVMKPVLSEQFVHIWNEKTNNNLISEHFLTWLTMSGIRRRLSFILEEIFPDKAYMTTYYGPAPGGFWPLLYVRRFMRVFGYLRKRKI
jgi:hypothetical protein